MNKTNIFSVLAGIFIILFVMSMSVYAEDSGNTENKSIINLEVSIKGNPENAMAGDILSEYLKKGLASKEDVVFAEDNPDWTISIVMLPVDVFRGHLGWAISVVFIRHLLEYPGHMNLFKEEYKDFGMFLTKRAEFMEDHLLSIASRDSLRSKCDEIILIFDKNCLEPARKKLDW